MNEALFTTSWDLADRPILPPIILDLSLLLSPFGPYVTQRLSQHGEVWLPRSLVSLLEGDGLPLDASTQDGLMPAITLWTSCWPETVQRPRVHWLSDALDMSHAPKGEPPALLDRFDALVAALDDKVGRFSRASLAEGHEALMFEGARDSLCLAAALRHDAALVLSIQSHGAAEPWVCRAVERFGVSSHFLSDEPLREILAARLLRGFARAGLAPLLGGGVARMAALYLATPGCAVPLPAARPAIGGALRGEPDEAALASIFEDEPDESLWSNAIAVWHEVP